MKQSLLRGVTDGRSNGEEAHWYTLWCACESGVNYISEYFFILCGEVDFEVPVILGRLFLASGYASVDMKKGNMKFRLNNKEETFIICRSIKQNGEQQIVSAISLRVKSISEVRIENRLGVEALTQLLWILRLIVVKVMVL